MNGEDWVLTGANEWRHEGLQGQVTQQLICWLEWRWYDETIWVPEGVHPSQVYTGPVTSLPGQA
jgi:hypothetical protein